MLSNKTLRNIPEYSRAFKTKIPFNHIVIDDFFKEEIIEKLLDEVEFIASTPSELWRFVGGGDDYDKHDDQINKKQIYSFENMLPTMQEVIKYLNSKQFLKIVSEITGLENLSNESETFTNAAYHQTSRDGRLEIHHDFNDSYISPNLFRQVNLLVYLNSVWDVQWDGDLELWYKNMSGPCKKISPIANRVVIFNIDKAPHGHPHPLQCPDEIHRKSLALYYYNTDKPQYQIVNRAIWNSEIDTLE
jgi:Rps23 Pro-64 3,4-dihydroxylase Tpa1-like proline 4-hydroxylase